MRDPFVVMPQNPQSLPVDSDALGQISPEPPFPQIPSASSYSSKQSPLTTDRELLRETLEEYFHKYRNAGTVIDGLRPSCFAIGPTSTRTPRGNNWPSCCWRSSSLRAPLPEERPQLLRRCCCGMGDVLGTPWGGLRSLGGPIADALRDMLPRYRCLPRARQTPTRAGSSRVAAKPPIPTIWRLSGLRLDW